MKNVLLFLAKLLGFSLLLYAAHKPLMMAYEFVLLGFIFQFPTSALMPPGIYYDSSLWLIPTLALVLATPQLSWQRRVVMLLVAVCAYWALDLFSFFLWVTPPLPNVKASEAHYLYSLIWKMVGQWVMPFMVWLIAASRQVGEYFAARA
ncbi:MAG: hypothetical protein RQ754_08780 [Desulfuromonadales bacterium]|nr:hypothetical protein [Desulfuromonadales bacterium]